MKVIGMIDWPAVKRDQNSRYAWPMLIGQKRDPVHVIDGDIRGRACELRL